MHSGDFIITPNWAWHDHVNEGEGPVVWLDGLDTPLVGFLDAVFRETYTEPRFPTTRPEGDAPARYGAGLAPMGARPDGAASPVFNYPYARARAALDETARAGRWDAVHGIKMRYIDPTTGGDATPTMAAYLQLLPAGFAGADYRSTDGAVFCVAEGTGRTVIGDDVLEWRPRDVFVVPGWRRHRFETDAEAVLFSYSDRPAQQALGLWREESA
jgi:gentisate 1,2-dioxygenase